VLQQKLGICVSCQAGLPNRWQSRQRLLLTVNGLRVPHLIAFIYPMLLQDCLRA